MGKYWPGKEHWQRIAPDDAGFDRQAIDRAVAFAIAHDSPMNRDIRQALEDGHFSEPPPINKIVGPVKDRTEPGGVILRGGRIVAEWGDVERVDMTFSATKSYLSLCADHNLLVANPSTMTVIVTPLDGSSKGLAVVEKTATGIKVVELNGGTGDDSYQFNADAERNSLFENDPVGGSDTLDFGRSQLGVSKQGLFRSMATSMGFSLLRKFVACNTSFWSGCR